mmetsp:Transcript_102799/g.265744  ORF Transcript_102799/g.265744 Transcript_102799/m.265744 type:complete len:223 (-) Transcript_102799:39-707(-)
MHLATREHLKDPALLQVDPLHVGVDVRQALRRVEEADEAPRRRVSLTPLIELLLGQPCPVREVVHVEHGPAQKQSLIHVNTHAADLLQALDTGIDEHDSLVQIDRTCVGLRVEVKGGERRIDLPGNAARRQEDVDHEDFVRVHAAVAVRVKDLELPLRVLHEVKCPLEVFQAEAQLRALAAPLLKDGQHIPDQVCRLEAEGNLLRQDHALVETDFVPHGGVL